jgi:hypothetical protein
MKHLRCTGCGQSFEAASGFAAFGGTLCRPCTEQALEERQARGEQIPEGSLVGLRDPTICAACGTDYGSIELPQSARLPLCAACEPVVMNRPFPAWLKLGLAGVVVLAALSFWWHQRFFAAYLAMARGNRAFAAQDFDSAAGLMEEAAARVPEARDLAGQASLLRGLALLEHDEADKAVAFLERAKTAFPGVPFIERVLLTAQAGAAFDQKDFALFLERNQQILRQNPAEPMAEAGVASAYACQYAVSGDEKLKAEAIAHLDKARQLVKGKSPELDYYEQRIRRRLDTREILSLSEYRRRYPEPSAQ